MPTLKQKFRWYLYPFSIIYGTIVSFRNFLFNANILKTEEFDIPVISVGNITVGGTGKTPHTEYLIKLLSEKLNVAVLSRGYKRKSKGFVFASPQSTIFDIGDEPKQIKQNFKDVDVAVCESRVKGINRLSNDENRKNLNVILLDDAYQHRYVKPGLSILLIDYYRPINEDHLLPYGSLRENQHEKSRANIIIVSKTPKNIKPIERRIIEKNLALFPYQSLYFTSLNYGELKSVFESSQLVDLNDNYHILLVTGIANPLPLKNHLAEYSKNIFHLQYRDHHAFSPADFEKIQSTFNEIKSDKKIIITTQKDGMRIQDLKGHENLKSLPIFYIPIEIEFLNQDKITFNNQIIDYITKNKRVNKSIS
ncbi:MAG TPA: tetraacyldisaccharide 4'-kinase [Bacteroidales bacterium]|nr:MAG: tetraacyldisaccharide 4'-kinase [Bacteroidetes bacterium GWF2_33_38]OFY75177.1 MAG: tetraacyldisaccharide 4'-kinase [Bacteroidetes bacterium RIFOXYA12_FULL_33_9]OFY88971.1 MAG: tetraacyldisaccharide 4'-kinase [Bacteroidetes bacterium RIFOXYA2_FULL_33_7]HBF88973.1 tetraacyldisaccharide 4'-kinase [Bacteroidales bacterium]